MTEAATFTPAVLDATLERITFANEETDYTVARADTGRGGDLVTVVGALFGAQPGEALRMRGRGARIGGTAGSSTSRTSGPCCPRPSRASAGTWVPGWSRGSGRSWPRRSWTTSA